MEGIADLIAMILGAGTKHMVARLLGRFLPPEWAGLLVGVGLYWFGDRVHPLVKTYGTGMLVASAGQLLAGFVPALAPRARRWGGGGEYYDSPEEYIKAKYGV